MNDITGVPPYDNDIAFYQSRVQVLTNHLQRRGLLPFSCKCCGQYTALSLMGYKKDFTVIPTNNVGQYYPAYHLTCGNCGYIHTFAADIVEKL